MEDLQLVLFVLGAIAILAVLVHGFWSIRKQNDKTMLDRSITDINKKSPFAQRGNDADGFDDDGIGEVRVRKVKENPLQKSAQHNTQRKIHSKQEPVLTKESSHHVAHESHYESEKPLEEENVTQINDADANQQAYDESNSAPHQTADISSLHAENTHTQDVESPVEHQPQEAITQETLSQQKVAQEIEAQTQEEVQEPALDEPKDVLVLHVVAQEGEVIQGTDLLPCLLTLNFKYGDMNIFHRHEDNAGTGKVLFSLANMVKPGIFEPEHMEQFNTHGVALFMTLPCYGDPLRNFSIMLNSAHQLADDLNAVLLDGQRQPWDDVAKQEYLRRIRAVVR